MLLAAWWPPGGSSAAISRSLRPHRRLLQLGFNGTADGQALNDIAALVDAKGRLWTAREMLRRFAQERPLSLAAQIDAGPSCSGTISAGS